MFCHIHAPFKVKYAKLVLWTLAYLNAMGTKVSKENFSINITYLSIVVLHYMSVLLCFCHTTYVFYRHKRYEMNISIRKGLL